MTQHFGKTWWGRQWLNSLNNIDYSNRLPRGSRYARNGSIKKIKIQDNEIHAKVSGSRPRPYDVAVVIPPFSDPDWSRFIDELIARPAIISKLLNRELDPEVLEIAEAVGLTVFPSQWTDFQMQCSCPDWAVPCKHLAAVIYKVSAEIDNNPFLVFDLHWADLIKELNNHGILISRKTTEIPFLNDLCLENKSTRELKHFNPEDAYQKLSYATLEPIHEPLIALLDDNPAFFPGKTNFKQLYQKSLNRVVLNAGRILQGKTRPEKFWTRTPIDPPGIDVSDSFSVSVDYDFITEIQNSYGDTYSFSDFASVALTIPAHRLVDYQPSTAALHSALYLSLHLIANGAVVPQIVAITGPRFIIRWLPAMLSKEVRSLVAQFSGILPEDIFVWIEGEETRNVNVNTGLNLLSLFISEWMEPLQTGKLKEYYVDFFFGNIFYGFKRPGEEEIKGGIQSWLQKYYLSQGRYKPQIIVESYDPDEFAVDVHVITSGNGLVQSIPLHKILSQKKYDRERYEILQSITQLSGFIPGLDDYINAGGKTRIVMNNSTFTPFLLQMIPAVRLLDIDILLPKSLQNILKPRPSIKLKKKPGKSFLRLDQLLDFDWQIAIGDHLMDAKEFQKLLKKSDRLIQYKSQYFYVNEDDLEKLHKFFNAQEDLSAYQLLRAALSEEYYGAKVALTSEVEEMIREITETQNIAIPDSLNATLRKYQERGYSWMCRNAKIGFGSVIADDMGLGKTVQVIATLLKYKEEGLLDERKVLIIVPTGLLTNWQAEIERFGPILKTHIYHGALRTLNTDFDILLTSYGIARSEKARLRKLSWHVLVIDEAQNIKNSDTAQSKAVRSIPADNFIAMSGTPVENRLSELWSIVDFTNRGLLGSDKEFQESFGKPIEIHNDEKVAEKLKKVTAPFMMRRLKTDKSIISDLPDKIEINSFATLETEQAGLYESTLTEAMKAIEAIDATDKKGLFVRQGLVLQMILALKQICNHPTQFLKNNVLEASLSGKMNLLFDKLDSILDSGEKVLIFTQFTEMGKLLKGFITERYCQEPLYYHGGSSVKKRQEMIDSFQNNPAEKVFILSLKATGTGLNLTAASHVIHYDLWWNPAVEQQATDRAYRIGQEKNVMVHRFITKNTFEERINDMIQSKKALADMTVATGENWIGNLSNKELKEVFEVK